MDTGRLIPNGNLENYPGTEKLGEECATTAIAFNKLPDEIIEQILRLCDPNSFASLVLLNSTWRRISQQPHLYVHHLLRCPPYATGRVAIPSGMDEADLPILRKLFGLEAKRNLFEAYLRPRETIVILMSTSISSSAAFPGGEAFHFSFSPSGHHLLAYSSSRIYVIDMTLDEPKVKKELKILRRPASTTILDDGSLLAVLSTDHQVDLYDLTEVHSKHVTAVALDHPPRTIALSPTGSVLAAAYIGGIEVYSLSTTASSADRRAVKCDAVDSLSFSKDGTQLLGTTTQSKDPSTVILTAPYYNPAENMSDDPTSQLWTTSILFPNSTRDCSHAILLPSPLYEEANWTFTYDRVFETFRAVRNDDLRNGTTYFVGPAMDTDSAVRLLPSTLPAATSSGTMVSAGFQGKEIWIYGVPRDLDTSPESTPGHADSDNDAPLNNVGRMNSSGSSRSGIRPRDGNISRIPQWQLLSDKSRNKFIEGRKVGCLDGVTAVRWIMKSTSTVCAERLVAVAPGVVGQHMEFDEDGIPPVDGGRISILDFDHSIKDGERRSLTIEVGDNQPEILEEEHRDIEAEVAIVRRRTVAQRQGGRNSMLSSTTVNPDRRPSATSLTFPMPDIPAMPAPPPIPAINRSLGVPTDQLTEVASVDDDGESFDAPYAHDGPRSGGTLRRAATAAAINRRLHPRVVAQEHIQYRRADGREEHPHESDADNWVPPPPPYTKDAVDTLPEHLRNAVPADPWPLVPTSNLNRSATQRTSGSGDSDIISSLQRSRTTFIPRSDARQTLPWENPAINSTMAFPTNTSDDPINRSVSPEEPNEPVFDDLYDVSPPGTPEPEYSEPFFLTPTRPIERRPVSAPAPVLADVSPQSMTTCTVHDTTASEGDFESLDIFRNVLPSDTNGEAAPRPVGKTGTLELPRPTQAPPALTKARHDAPVPPRPTEDHRLSEVPSSISVEARTPPNDTGVINLSSHPSAAKSEPDISAAIGPRASEEQVTADFGFPSAAQLARLNSRSGRPPSRILTDPTRRSSESFGQSRLATPQSPNSPSNGVPVSSRNAPPLPPRNTSSDGRSSGLQDQHTNPSRHISIGPVRHGQSTPNLRPRPNRLETIHSVASQFDPAMAMQRSRSQTGMTRQPSTAERSTTVRKRNGWRGTIKRRKERKSNQAMLSTNDWTEVSGDSFGNKVEKKNKICVVM